MGLQRNTQPKSLEACEERSDGVLLVGVEVFVGRLPSQIRLCKKCVCHLGSQIKLHTKTPPTSLKPDNKQRASKASVLSDLSPQEIPRNIGLVV